MSSVLGSSDWTKMSEGLLVARNVLVLNPVVVYQDISENLLS